VDAAALAVIALLLWQSVAGGPLAGHALALIAATLIYVVVAGAPRRGRSETWIS